MVAYYGCGCLCVVLAFSRFCYALMRLCFSLVVVISAFCLYARISRCCVMCVCTWVVLSFSRFGMR